MSVEPIAPHSVEVEQAVLGSVLVYEAAYDELAFQLNMQPDDFFIVRHGWVWEAYQELRRDGIAIDYMTVVNYLEQRSRLAEVGGAAYILGLVNQTPSALNAVGYGRIVLQMATRRALIDVAQQTARGAHADGTDVMAVIERARKMLERVSREPAASLSVREVSHRLNDRWLAAEDAARAGRKLALSTGLPELDYITADGLHFGKLVGILAASEHGKSTAICQIAPAFARQCPVLIVSQEMEPEAVLHRMACIMATVPGGLLADGKMSQEQQLAYAKARMELEELPLEFLSKRQSVGEIAGLVHQMSARHGGAKGVVFIDTVQKLVDVMQTRHGRTEGTAGASSLLDGLKLDTGWMVVALMQQYVETNTMDPLKLRPTRNNVKDSKALFEDLDIGIGLYRADVWRQEYGPAFQDSKCPPGTAMIRVIKNRYGPRDRVELLDWLGAIPAFRSRKNVHTPQIDSLESIKQKLAAKEEAGLLPEIEV